MTVAIFPGTFDPITLGHLNIISRSSAVYDEVIVAMLVNNSKTPMFSVEERREFIAECTKHLPNVRIVNFDGLLVKFAKSVGAKIAIRGLRAVADYENELAMAAANKELDPDMETSLMLTDPRYSYVSSSIVKSILKTDITVNVSFAVPEIVQAAMKKKMSPNT